MAVSIEDIKKLRHMTGAGMMTFLCLIHAQVLIEVNNSPLFYSICEIMIIQRISIISKCGF